MTHQQKNGNEQHRTNRTSNLASYVAAGAVILTLVSVLMPTRPGPKRHDITVSEDGKQSAYMLFTPGNSHDSELYISDGWLGARRLTKMPGPEYRPTFVGKNIYFGYFDPTTGNKQIGSVPSKGGPYEYKDVTNYTPADQYWADFRIKDGKITAARFCIEDNADCENIAGTYTWNLGEDSSKAIKIDPEKSN